jgi:hypothetical protein
LSATSTTAKKIYDFIEEHISISPVGIIPHQQRLRLPDAERSVALRDACVQYEITLFENPSERFRGLHVSFIASMKKAC